MTDPYRPKPRSEPRTKRAPRGGRVDAMFVRLARLGATEEMIAEARESFDAEDDETKAEITRAFAGAPDDAIRAGIEEHLAAEAEDPEPDPEPAPPPVKKKAPAKKAAAKVKAPARG